jgi:hypothetical protein
MTQGLAIAFPLEIAGIDNKYPAGVEIQFNEGN